MSLKQIDATTHTIDATTRKTWSREALASLLDLLGSLLRRFGTLRSVLAANSGALGGVLERLRKVFASFLPSSSLPLSLSASPTLLLVIYPVPVPLSSLPFVLIFSALLSLLGCFGTFSGGFCTKDQTRALSKTGV